MKNRCFWVTDSKIYQEYHDNEKSESSLNEEAGEQNSSKWFINLIVFIVFSNQWEK